MTAIPAPATPDTPRLVAVANVGALDLDADGWALLAPYGDLPHSEGIQRFPREAADALVARYRSFASRIKRAIVGMPIYRGHPDHPAFANKYPDKTHFGNVAGLAAREDGLYWRPVLSEEGAELVEQGVKYPSINWLCQPLADHIYQPVEAISVGLVENPNIAGAQSLSNAIPDAPGQPAINTTTANMLDALIKLLGLPEGATEEEVTAAIGELKTKVDSMAAEPETMPNGDKAKMEETLANAKASAAAEVAQIKSELDKARQQLANERRERCEALLADALQSGRILANEHDTWLKRLDRDFESESEALKKLAPALPNERLTRHLRPGQNVSDAEEKTAAIQALVSERRAATGELHHVAFANVKADPKNKALFE